MEFERCQFGIIEEIVPSGIFALSAKDILLQNDYKRFILDSKTYYANEKRLEKEQNDHLHVYFKSYGIRVQVYVPQNIHKIYFLHKISKTRF